jgi:hypothetical protein
VCRNDLERVGRRDRGREAAEKELAGIHAVGDWAPAFAAAP